MEQKKEIKAWREIQKGKWADAIRGLYVLYKTTIAFRIQMIVAIFVIIFGFYFKVSNLEWIMLVFSIGLVIIAETVNTAIEIDIDLTSPEYHPFARDTKDVAAAAVLLSAIVAVVVGIIIFLPKIF